MNLWSLLFCLLLSLAATGQPAERFEYQAGDLLFQDLDCGDLCDAIEKVTPGFEGKHFSHVGIAYLQGDSVYVIEAIGKDVHSTPLRQFLARQRDGRGNPKVVVGRLKPEYQRLRKTAVLFALRQSGVPYDDAFGYDNGKYYCSELVYDAFMHANGDQPIFELPPMTYKDPSTGKTFPAWEKYFHELHEPIPEGKPGCNPGGLANSTSIEIIESFY